MKIGEKFNLLTVIEYPIYDITPKGAKILKAKCRCDCGTIKDIRKQSITSGITKSCGCYNKKAASERMSKYNEKSSHGLLQHPLYNKWKRIKQHGNTYVKEWESFQTFYDWGKDKYVEGYSLSRIDKDKPYGPDNCTFKSSSQIATENMTKDTKEKIRQTNIERYGVPSVLCLPENNAWSIMSDEQKEQAIQKQKDTLKQKYGVDNTMNIPGVREKIQQANLKKYGVKHHTQSKQYKQAARQRAIDNGLTQYHKGGQSLSEWAEDKGLSYTAMLNRVKKYGFDEALSMDRYETGIEKDIENVLINLNVTYQKQFRIENRIADFLIPSHNIIIECDGLYWHSDAVLEDKNYHKDKRQLYLDHGYSSMFFREDEIETKVHIIESILRNKLGLVDKLNARSCVVVSVDSPAQFFEDNHLMGKGKGKCIGLEHEGELVAAMRLVHKKEYTDISRFCTKINTNVRGAFSKLIKQINGPISTFIDLRYGSGDYLHNFGFEETSNNLSFKWVRDHETIHRYIYPGNSGYKHRCYKIWDCGQKRFLKK